MKKNLIVLLFLIGCFILYLSSNNQSTSKIILQNNYKNCKLLDTFYQYIVIHDNRILFNTLGELEKLTNINSLAMKGYAGIFYTSDTDFYCDYIAFAKKLNCYDKRFTVKEILFYDSIRPYRVSISDSFVSFKSYKKNKN